MRLSALLAVALLAAGCLSSGGGRDDPAGDARHVSAEIVVEATAVQPDDIFDEGRDLTMTWSDSLGAGAEVPLVNSALLDQYASVAHEVPADGSVKVITLGLTGTDVGVARLRDDDGNLLCVARTGRTCATRVNETALVRFPVEVISLAPEGTDVVLRATLSPDEPTLGADPTPLATGFTVFRDEAEGGEPTLAIAADGRVLVVAGTGVLRLEPDGSFSDVTPPVEAALSQTLDPFLYGDSATGRIYVTQLSQCLRVWWTDDVGENWDGNPEVCAGPEQHHQKVAVGPGPLPGVPGAADAPRAIHIATMNLASWLTTDELVVFHTRSLDGGLTWSQNPSKVVAADGTPELRNIGNIATAETPGVVHAIAYVCDRFVDADFGGVAAGKSTDYGATWTWQVIAPGGGRCEGIDPGIWVSPQGEAWAAWEDMTQGTGHVWMAHTDDGAWTEPMQLDTPGLGSFVFTDIAVEGNAKAIAFLATPDTTLGPTQAPGWARWYPYVALEELHGWQTYKLQEDPVQLGPICMDGPKCLDGARNLLDFIDVRVDPEVGAVVAYPDGCEDPCSWPYESRSAFLRIAVIQHPLS